MVPFLCERGVRLVAELTREVALIVRLMMLAERRNGDIPDTTLVAAVIPIVTTHVVIEVFE